MIWTHAACERLQEGVRGAKGDGLEGGDRFAGGNRRRRWVRVSDGAAGIGGVAVQGGDRGFGKSQRWALLAFVVLRCGSAAGCSGGAMQRIEMGLVGCLILGNCAGEIEEFI